MKLPRLFSSLLLSLILCAIMPSCKSGTNNTSSGVEANEYFAEITIDKLDSLKSLRPEYVLIDVRTPEETKEGMLEGAIEMNYFDGDFKDQLNELDKKQPYLMYCRSGNRSGKAMKIMQKLGFKHVINLDGGYELWKELNMPE